MIEKMKKGFTIVELSLSLIFLSIMMISIAVLTTRITSIYEKGTTMKQLNLAGAELVDEFTRAIAGAPVMDPRGLSCGTGNYMDCIYKQRTAQLEDGRIVPTNGVFCSGKYSFIWNTGYALNSIHAPDGVGNKKIKFRDNQSHIATVNGLNSSTRTNFKLMRIRDDGRSICMDHASVNSDTYTAAATNISDSRHSFEILDNRNGYNNLVIYDVKIFAPTYQVITNHSFYSGTFTMATLAGDVDILSSGDYCSSEYTNSLNTEFAYCAINKFNFASRATGAIL